MTFSCNVVTMATYHLKEPWLPDDILAVELLNLGWSPWLHQYIYYCFHTNTQPVNLLSVSMTPLMLCCLAM